MRFPPLPVAQLQEIATSPFMIQVGSKMVTIPGNIEKNDPFGIVIVFDSVGSEMS